MGRVRWGALWRYVRVGLFWLLFTLFSLSLSLFIAFQIPLVQRWAGQEVSRLARSSYGLSLTIDRIAYRPPLGIRLEGLLLHDQHGDTLLAAADVRTAFVRLGGGGKHLVLGTTHLSDGAVCLRVDSSGVLNIKEVLSRLKKEKKKEKKAHFVLDIRKIFLEDVRFLYYKPGKEDLPGRVNYSNLDFRDVAIEANHFRSVADTVRMDIKSLKLRDRSGLIIDNLAGRLALCGSYIHLSNVQLMTPESDLHLGDLRLSYTNWQSLKRFVTDVQMHLQFDESRLSSSTLGYFASLAIPSPLELSLKGELRGSVSDFDFKDFYIGYADSTELLMSGMLSGLPHVATTMVSVDIDRVRTTSADIGRVVTAFSKSGAQLPKVLKRIQSIGYRGSVVGFLNDFVATGRLKSNLGNIALDVMLAVDSVGGMRFGGDVQTPRLALGVLVQDSTIGDAVLTASVRGEMSKRMGLRSNVKARIDAIELLHHNYRNIDIAGVVNSRGYTGSVEVADTALRLSFNGEVDLSTEMPKFDFHLTAPHVDLHQMNINRADSISVASLAVDASCHGMTLDDIEGDLLFSALSYRNQLGHIAIPKIKFSAHNVAGGKLILLDSPLANATLWGESEYVHVWPKLRRMLAMHLPAVLPPVSAMLADSINLQQPSVASAQRKDALLPYRAEVQFGNCDTLLKVLMPKVQIARGTHINCGFDPQEEVFDATIRSDSLRYGNMQANGLLINLDRPDGAVRLHVAIGQGKMANLAMDDIDLSTILLQDTMHSQLHVKTPSLAKSNLNLNWTTVLYPPDSITPRQLSVRIDSSSLIVDSLHWTISRARILADTSSVRITNFHLRNAQRRLSISGVASRRPTDSISVYLDNVDLQLFDPLLPAYALSGLCQGEIHIHTLLAKPDIRGALQLANISIDGTPIGTSTISGRWAGAERPFHFSLVNTTLEGRRDMDIQAKWDVKRNAFEAQCKLDKWNLAPLEVFTRGQIAARGALSTDLTLSGTLAKPIVQGWLTFDNATIHSSLLNTNFVTSATIHAQKQTLLFQKFLIEDAQGNDLIIDGAIDFKTLKKPYINVAAHSNRFMLLNASALRNPLYSGQLVATTKVKAIGTPENLKIDLSVRTDPGTSLAFQLPRQRQAKETKQLSFVLSPQDSIRLKAQELQSDSQRYVPKLAMNIDLQVTQNALTQFVLNPQTGEGIKARGTGDLQIQTNPERHSVRIFGDYTMQWGEYTFVFENLLSKKFRISQGSTIRFTGDPLNAYADIVAVYRTRETLDKLFGDLANEKYKRRVPVDCKIHIVGTVKDPRITFEIDVPQADAETQGLLASALNTDEKLLRQFGSLLLLNTFSPDSRGQAQVATADGKQTPGGSGIAFDDVLLSSFWELLSNQLNSWISQIDNAPQIGLGFNYRKGNETTPQAEDEAEVSLSMQWFDGRLNIDANWDVNKNNTSSAVAGDIVVTQQSMLLKDLQYKAFAQSNDDLVFNDLAPYTAGAGVVYSVSFDNLGDLWRRLRKTFGRKKESKE